MNLLRPLLLAVAALLVFGAHAQAATFNVNSTADAADVNTSDGVCAAAGGACTLRAAVEQANALMGADVINVPANTYNTASQLTISSNVTLCGAGAASTRIVGNGGSIIVRAQGSAEVAISGATLAGGTIGVYVQGSELTLDRVVITGNTSTGSGSGAGMRADADSKVLIKNSAITGNVVEAANAYGAGIHFSGVQLDIRSTTIAGNVVRGSSGARGGGIYMNFGTLSLRHVTMSGNKVESGTADRYGGNLNMTNSSSGTTSDSIFAGGVANAGHENCSGKLPVATGRNIDSGTSCGFGAGQLSSTDPKLGALDSAAGAVAGMLPGLGSPALGQASACHDDGVDQRGAPAPTGAGCDIGAIEHSSNVAVKLTQSRTDVAPGGDVALIATVTNTGFDPAQAAKLDLTHTGASEVVMAVPSTGTCTKAVRCELGTLAPGATVLVTVVLRAGAAAAVTAKATVSASTPGAATADDTASASATIASTAPVPGGGDTTPNAAPVLGALKRSGAGRSGKAIKLTSTLSEEATLAIQIQRLVPGRRAGKRCSATAKRGARCTVARAGGSLTTRANAGAVTITIPAKVKRRKLAAGRYRISIVATDAGGLRSATRTLTLNVTR
jgi:CSLREA domain-containing protein